jgi:hypothetical protein
MRIRQNKGTVGSYTPIVILIFIWLFAFLLSSPLFFFNTINSMLLDFNDNNLLGGNGNGHFNHTSPTAEDHHADNGVLPESSSTTTSATTTSQNDMFDFDTSDLKFIKIDHCIESSPFMSSRLIYSYASLLIQYTFPILIVGVAYGSIWWKLKTHRNKLKNHKDAAMQSSTRKAPDASKSPKVVVKNETTAKHPLNKKKKNNNKNAELKVVDNEPHISLTPTPVNIGGSALERHSTVKNNESRRRLKMNVLLTFIAIIFAASWLPLNLFNILSDSKMSIIRPSPTYYIINAVCILFGMSSAVSNPFLYGFLNENFKREYVKLFEGIAKRCACLVKRKEVAAATAAAANKTPKTGRKDQHTRQAEDSPNTGRNLGNKLTSSQPDRAAKFTNLNRHGSQKEQNQLIGNPVILINSENLNENNLA